jgi:large subunit ribosomal protein L35
MKTKSSAKKRFKLTASGKIKREKAYKSHILTKKSRKTKRNLRQATLVHKTDLDRVTKMLCIG